MPVLHKQSIYTNFQQVTLDTGYKGAYGAKMYFTVVGPHGHVNYRRFTEELCAILETPELH